ncbi:MAG: TetR/AcrR family transcriptional regulator [Deltaproteobacteria bacterium]|nr:TetR/AcrR family transcriptional regulator [Deltaproteobacteria bacterium]
MSKPNAEEQQDASQIDAANVASASKSTTRAKTPLEAKPRKSTSSSTSDAKKETKVSSAARGKKGKASKDGRRKEILLAAIRVFAERGYHGCRISDIADEAGVAYGLVYHYYGNKDGLLRTIFEKYWGVFSRAIHEIAEAELSGREKIERFIDWIVGSYDLSPEVLKVLLLEFGRSSRIGDTIKDPELQAVFKVFAKTFAQAQREGALDPDADPNALGLIFFAAIEAGLVQVVLPHHEGKERKSGEARIALENLRKTVRGLFLPKGYETTSRD